MTTFQKVQRSTSNNNKLQILLANCEPYMLTNINLLKCISESVSLSNYSDIYTKTIINTDNKPPVIKRERPSSIEKKNVQPEYATIKEKDTLFWCYYIIKYGYDDYEMVTQKFSVEKNLKIECITQIRKDKELLKKYKLKRSEIESELLNDEILSLKGFLTLCIYNNINFLLIDNRKYYELVVNDQVEHDKVSCNIIKCERGKYTVDITDEKEIIENKLTTYRNNYYKIENLTKPIKSFSTYSLPDMIEICDNLKISVTGPDGKKLKKKELYTEILKHF